MAGVRRWTEEEGQAIRAAADRNREADSGFGGRGRHGRLRAVAVAFGRSYGNARRAREGAGDMRPGAVTRAEAQSTQRRLHGAGYRGRTKKAGGARG